MLSAIGNGQEKLDDKDPIQPIIDIVRGSLMKYDYETVKDGLSAIRDRTNIIFKNSTLSEEEEAKVSEHVFSHLANIGMLAASRDDEYCTLKVIIDLHKIGMITVEQDLHLATWHAVDSLGTVGIVAAKQKIEGTGRAVIGLKSIGVMATEHKLGMAVELVVYKIGDIGEVAAKNKLRGATWWAAKSLGEIGIIAVKQELKDALRAAIVSLKSFGVAAAEYKFEKETSMVEDSLNEIYETLSKLEKE